MKRLLLHGSEPLSNSHMTLSTTNPTWIYMRANPGLHGQEQSTKRLSCGITLHFRQRTVGRQIPNCMAAGIPRIYCALNVFLNAIVISYQMFKLGHILKDLLMIFILRFYAAVW